MDIAAKFIRADERYQTVMVIGGYAMSKYLNKNDKKTVTLFADGAGAAIFTAEPHQTTTERLDEPPPRGYLASELRTEGEYNGWMGIYGGAAHAPISDAVVANNDHLLKFVQKFPPELNPDRWTTMIRAVTARAGITPKDAQHYFFTQININSIRETMARLDVPFEKAHNIMDRFGYTGSACIAMALDDAWQQGKLNQGDVLVFMGSGGGLAFASSVIRL
jgi:3-oxoacyl-[acyl-carrier-protein] synthase III